MAKKPVYNLIDLWEDPAEVNEYFSPISISLEELIECGAVDFSASDMRYNWYSEPARESMNAKIVARFGMRDISIAPPGRWKQQFMRLMNEIEPKYSIWYKKLEDFDIFRTGKYNTEASETTSGTTSGTTNSTTSAKDTSGTTTTNNTDEYSKNREIGSDFPQTQLAGNADYASTGKDYEGETVGENTTIVNGSGTTSGTMSGNTTGNTSAKKSDSGKGTNYGEDLEQILKFRRYADVEVAVLDELEALFASLITVNCDVY